MSLQAQLRDLLEGFERSQLLYVAAKLGLADLLGSSRKEVVWLAGQTGIESAVLYRVLRGLAWCGVVAHTPDDQWELTPLGEYLQRDREDSLVERALCIGDIEYPSWGQLLPALRDEKPAFERVFGQPFYEYLRQHPERGAYFDRMMGKGAVRVAESVVQAYDFSGLTRLVDIGGSNGSLLSIILAAYPQAQGVVFDLPSVIERTTAHPRIELVGGDFFEGLPTGGDAYLMKWILHNWADEHCVKLLRNCRRAMGEGARLLVLEQVMPARVDTTTETVGWDIGMLVHLGSSERTAGEFEQLFRQADLRLERLLPTSCGMSILEGFPA